MTNSRRSFLQSIAMLSAATVMPLSAFSFDSAKKLRIVMVGTGVRGNSFWGRRLVRNYGEILEFVGLSDINPGRLAYAKKFMEVSCPTFANFDEMVATTKPDLIIVTTVDATHHDYIIRGLNAGCDVLTEKPMTTDETKCQAILEAERKTGRKIIVGFNYRWSPYNTKIKELLMKPKEGIGELTSVDFNWYLNTFHGASYFRRWHGQTDKGGSLWVHKATHHFDLLNWWIDSDPVEVFAYGSLDHYGKSGPFRGKNCRTCDHKNDCEYYWDITKDRESMRLYVDHESHDGYIRDNCLFREEIDIFDKMSAQIKYANGVVVNYSLTTYSPIEGWRIAFNGQNGRIEGMLDLPYFKNVAVSQEDLHKAEMAQGDSEAETEGVIFHKLWNKHEVIEVPVERGGHGGGDSRLQDKIFITAGETEEFERSAGSRDGAFSCLIGIAARKSIAENRPIKISELTDLKPSPNRGKA